MILNLIGAAVVAYSFTVAAWLVINHHRPRRNETARGYARGRV